VIGGVGLVCGRECLITANEATVKGGATSEAGLWKNARLADIARINHLPSILLVESAGADLPVQSKIFVAGGRGFREITRRSKERIPTISVVFGSSTAGGAYLPGMSDYVVMVKKQAQVFLAGPPLVKMATGEVSDEESLGGAEMHSRKSGLSDYLAEDELDAIRMAREIVSHFNRARPSTPNLRAAQEPVCDPDELLGIASADVRVPFEIRDVIARIVDGSDFAEFKPEYGPTLVTGFAHIHGFPIGILGNNGVLMSESASKGAQFIQLCNQQSIPLLFLQNITGFMVGREAEIGGIAKDGAKMVHAVATTRVPKLTVVIGGSFGAGNYAMSGRAYGSRFLWMWPNARISVMGGEQAANVLLTIKQDQLAREGKPAMSQAEADEFKRPILEKYENEGNPYHSTARLWDDGVIDPMDTRQVLGLALSVVLNSPVEENNFGVFRM
jgi:acetyl-CoA carboxylase carboxyltransferase component